MLHCLSPVTPCHPLPLSLYHTEWVLVEHVQSLRVMHCSVKDQVVNTMIGDCISGTGLSFTVMLEWHNWLTQHIHPHLDTHFHTNCTHTASVDVREHAQIHTHTHTHFAAASIHTHAYSHTSETQKLMGAILIKIKAHMLWI